MGFTKIDNRILEKLITSDLTKRQIKIILLILRLSQGCQKSYALLERKDFRIAGIDRKHLKREIEKLRSLKILNLDREKKIYWISDPKEWKVKGKDVTKIVKKNLNFSHFWVQDLHRKCEKDVTKNVIAGSLKTLPEKEKRASKENIKEKDKEKKINNNIFFKALREYFRRISPLRREEVKIFLELLRRYGERAVKRAISIVAKGNDRSFSYFQKVLAGLEDRRMPGLERLKEILERYELQERIP